MLWLSNLRIKWLVDAMRSDVETAMNKKDFSGARAAITRCRERVGDDSNAAAYLQEITNNVDVGELFARYDTARQANKKSEARTLAEQLLERPNLPVGMRAYLRQQVGDAKGSSAR
jgi:hypothetical protein